MGYFANGTEGDTYEFNICRRCSNYPEHEEEDACPIWSIHVLFNYDQKAGDTLEEVLNLLIPRAGVHNDVCSMFIPLSDEDRHYAEAYHTFIETQMVKASARERPPA